jgi:pimeloyl-ACP methyl ester carboxylesterase/DNA-binding CsgD family transcriptional regulator
MEQSIRFCTSRDGVRIAWASSGTGPPLVKAANYLTHLEHEWNGPVWRHWLRELSARNTLVRYDERGSGLSDREVSDFSMDAWVRDLEAVVEAAGLTRFSLLGLSQGAPVAVRYAVLYPKKVSHLILCGGYARGRFHRDLSSEQRLEAETLINTIRVGWGRENPAFRQIFSTLLMPDATPEQTGSLNELARISAEPETAAAMERAFYDIDVIETARLVRVPTLVLHAKDDAGIPFQEGRLLASLIPGARFVVLESRNHILLPDEPAWERFVSEVHAFLETAQAPPAEVPDISLGDLTSRERNVLEGIARGLTNAEIAAALKIAEKTVRNQVSAIYEKLGVRGRAQAVVAAREAGLGTDRARPFP